MHLSLLLSQDPHQAHQDLKHQADNFQQYWVVIHNYYSSKQDDFWKQEEYRMLEEDEHECHNNSSYSKGEGLVCWKQICLNAEACYTPDDQIVECNMSIDDDRVKARASTFLYFYFVDKLIEVVFTIILALFPLLFHVF